MCIDGGRCCYSVSTVRVVIDVVTASAAGEGDSDSDGGVREYFDTYK